MKILRVALSMAAAMVLIGTLTSQPAGADHIGEPAVITGHFGSQHRAPSGGCNYGPDASTCSTHISAGEPPDRLRVSNGERIGIDFPFPDEDLPASVTVRWGDGPWSEVPPSDPTSATAEGHGPLTLAVSARWVEGDSSHSTTWNFDVDMTGCDDARAPHGDEVTGSDSDHDGVCDVFLIPAVSIQRADGDVAALAPASPPPSTTSSTVAPVPPTTTAAAPTAVPVAVKGTSFENATPSPVELVPDRPTSHGRSGASAVLLVAVLLLAGASALLARRMRRA